MHEQDRHELVAALKQLASEFGRAPTRDEFVARHSKAAMVRAFGSYAALLAAAGLESPRNAPRKFSREEVYGRDLEEVLQEHEPRPRTLIENFKPMLAVGDTHFPFVHRQTLERCYRFAEKEQPAFIVQVGDLLDQWSHGRFPTSRNYYRPDEEMEVGRKMAAEFWAEMRRLCPGAQCFQIMGNHDLRALKQVLQNAPTLEGLVAASIEKLYEFEGVTTVHDYRSELVLQDIMFHHGYMTRHGQQRDFVMQNLVSGHTHRGAVLYRPLKDRTIWHLDTGFVGDAESKALSYTAQKTTGWTLGWGWIDQYGPRFIPA